MTTPFQITDLSLRDPETGAYVIAFGETSRRSLGFDFGEPLTNAGVLLRRLDTGEETSGPVEGYAVDDDDILVVVVSGLTRGKTYELILTPTFADGEREPRTLILDCVA